MEALVLFLLIVIFISIASKFKPKKEPKKYKTSYKEYVAGLYERYNYERMSPEGKREYDKRYSSHGLILDDNELEMLDEELSEYYRKKWLEQLHDQYNSIKSQKDFEISLKYAEMQNYFLDDKGVNYESDFERYISKLNNDWINYNLFILEPFNYNSSSNLIYNESLNYLQEEFEPAKDEMNKQFESFTNYQFLFDNSILEHFMLPLINYLKKNKKK